jgi:hypothetical protein
LSPQEPLGWGCGRMLEKVGGLFQAAPDSKWGMGPGLAFGMTWCGDMALKVAFPTLFDSFCEGCLCCK